MIENIIQAIDQQAIDQPNKICYVDDNKTNTFGDLKVQSDRLANYLQTQNLNPETQIMVFGGQTFSMVATFLGCVKAGFAYIPVDTHSPNERLLQIQSVAHPSAVIAVEALPIELSDIDIVEQDQLADIFANQAEDYDADKSVSGDDNFYIIFTSGTTGMPKGVQISHTNLLSYVNWDVNDFDLPNGVRAMSQAPYSFDLSVMDLYPTLVLGGTLCALSRQVTENFKELFKVLPTLKLNEWVSTPSFVELCLLDPNFNHENYPDLSHFLFCGEELTNKTASTLLDRFPDAKVYNTYGPTEATVAVTGIQITREVLAEYPRLPIGFAKEDTTMYVADQNGDDIGADENGEIIIAGPSVSKGYLNNPEKTKKAFFDLNGQQAYRSGDLGYKKENGLFFYRGRTDFQVKLHGYRIELEDVDHNLNQLPYVKQAMTVPRYNADHKVAQLVAYVIPDKDAKFDDDASFSKALKHDLAENMMSYMIPQRFVFKQELPLTANGKIDRKALIAEVNPK